MTTNGSKDVLGSYAHCTETRRRVRYKLFCSNNAQTCDLPPTKDALKYHFARANYQACIWQTSLEAAAHTPSPHGHGWDVIDGHISIHWMDQQPAPKALLQFISCNCLKGHCVGGRCSCRNNVMSCTDACGCVECNNTQDIGRTENDSSGEDEDWTNNLVDPYAMSHFIISIWNTHFIELVVGKNDHCYFLLIHLQCTSYIHVDSYAATANTYCKRGMQQTLLFQTSRTYRYVKLTFSRRSLKAVVRSPVCDNDIDHKCTHVYLYQWMLGEFIPYCD